MRRNTTPDPRSTSVPQAANHAFSPYNLAFDEFAEPRTIPAHWDLSGLLVSAESPEEANLGQRGENPFKDQTHR